MNLFLIMSIPFWFLFLNSFYKNEGVRKRDFFIPLGKGSILFIVSLLLHWLFTTKLTLGRVTPAGVYLYNFFFYDGLTYIIWLTLFFIFQLIRPPVKEKIRTRELMLFLVPLFLGASIYRVIIQDSWYGIYELFLLPLSHMSLLVYLAIIIAREEKEEITGKILYFLLSLAVVLFSNLMALFVSYNLTWAAVLTGIVFFILSFLLFLREMNS